MALGSNRREIETLGARPLGDLQAILFGAIVIGTIGQNVAGVVIRLSLVLVSRILDLELISASGPPTDAEFLLDRTLPLVMVLSGAYVAAKLSGEQPVLIGLATGAASWMLTIAVRWGEVSSDPGLFIKSLFVLVLPLSALGGILARERRITSP